ncbi:MAG: hypothetical protein IKQ90_04940 [Ruminococcus sp.]|nr:hypothetical protein [Ruminococcus sp.]
MSIGDIIDRMAAIKEQSRLLDDEYDSLQAQLLIEAEHELSDTKSKSVSWTSGSSNSASVTISDTVSVVAGELLEDIFGKVFPSMAERKVTYTLKAPAKRILSAIWHNEYCEGSVSDVIGSLDCDDKTKKVLAKKVKGISFEKDKQNLMKLAGLSETEASDTAYLVNEAAAWENICTFIKVNNDGRITPEILKDIITKVNASVNVSRDMKAKITVHGDDEE